MTKISEAEFARICHRIWLDRAQIRQFNPNVAPAEVLLWMLLSCLISYLSLTEQETPCFPGAPDTEVYRTAILYALRGRTEPAFEPDEYLTELIEKAAD